LGKQERGTKRQCLGCAAKFYDLNRDPIVCPACSAPFVIPPKPAPRSKPNSAPATTVAPVTPPAPAAAEVNSPVDPEAQNKDDEETVPEVEGEEEVEDIGGDVANAFVEEEDTGEIGIKVIVEKETPT